MRQITSVIKSNTAKKQEFTGPFLIQLNHLWCGHLPLSQGSGRLMEVQHEVLNRGLSGNTGSFCKKNVKKVGKLLTEARCVMWSMLMVSVYYIWWRRMHSNLGIMTKIFFCRGNFHLFKKLESTFFFISHISKVNPHVHLHFLTLAITKIVHTLWWTKSHVCMRVCKHGWDVKMFCFLVC